jgi:hypothetical protein
VSSRLAAAARTKGSAERLASRCKARAVAQVDIALRRRENGQDALLTHINDRRHIIDAVGQITND